MVKAAEEEEDVEATESPAAAASREKRRLRQRRKRETLKQLRDQQRLPDEIATQDSPPTADDAGNAINGNIPDSTEQETGHQGIDKGNEIIASVAPVVIEAQQGKTAKKSRWESTVTTSTTMPVASTAMPAKRTEQESETRVTEHKSYYNPPKERSYYAPVYPDQYWCCMRDWDFLKDLNHAIKTSGHLPNKKEKGVKRSLDSDAKAQDNNSSVDSIPDSFESVEHYKALWAPLLINEAKAQLLSDVVASQASPNTSWIQGNNAVIGTSVCLEVSRTARDHSLSSTDNLNSSEPSIVLHIKPSNATNTTRSVSTNDLLLFVHQASAIERAVRGMFDGESGNQELQKGRFGFVGHALNNRSRSLDGLLVRVSKKYWIQFDSLTEMIVVQIGSNVTALREFNALSRVDSIPLTKYFLDGKKTIQKSNVSSSTIDKGSDEKSIDPLPVSDNLLPAGFQNFITSKMNSSQQDAITASASEYGDGGFTLIKGPPGTGKTTTLVSILNALHLRQYQEYYNSIERIVTGSDDSTYYEELAALNKAAEMKPRILVCAPSNAGIDNVILKIMSDKFVDGQGGNYAPSITRVGAGITSSKIESVTLKHSVDNIIAQGCDTINLENTIATLRNSLKRIQKEMQKLRARLKAMVESCPYEISSEWEIRIDEQSFENTGQVLFVNHSTKTTTFELPLKVRPTETPCIIHQMPHYRSLVKFLTKFVERYSNESSNLEKYIMLQNAANSKMDGDRGGSSTDGSIPMSLLEEKIAIAVLNSSHIVLTTLGSAGGRAMTSANRFKVVVIDEAAQSAEPSTLVALQLGSKHAILVGDPQQLPATIFSVSGRSTKYDRSLFQRLEEAGHDVHMLNMQYRMHPMISKFPRHIFYQGSLLDGPNVKHPDFGGSLKTILGIRFPSVRPFNMYDLDSKEERNGTSLSNKYEAKLAVQLYCTLDRVSDGLLVKTRVAIITPYSQQSSLLHRLFDEKYGPTYVHRVEIR
jgi:senataxin